MSEPTVVYGLHQAAALIVAGHELVRAKPCGEGLTQWAFEFGAEALPDLEAYSERRLHGNLSDLFHARKMLIRLARKESSVKAIKKWREKRAKGEE